jgi:hypothetical protein
VLDAELTSNKLAMMTEQPEDEMTNENDLVINDVLDIIEELTNMVEELNPGATEQVRRIRFLVGRAERLTNRRDSQPHC